MPAFIAGGFLTTAVRGTKYTGLVTGLVIVGKGRSTRMEVPISTDIQLLPMHGQDSRGAGPPLRANIHSNVPNNSYDRTCL